MNKICHVVPSMGESGGGPPRSVGQLCDNLSKKIQVHIVATDDPDDRLVSICEEVQMHFVSGENRTMFGRLRAAGFDKALESLHEKHQISIFHQHGIWLRCSHETTSFASLYSLPLILAPRGMLEPWAINHRKWRKKVAWSLFQKQDLSKVTAFHATAESEAQSIRRLGLKQPIAIIPNGVVLPQIEEVGTRSLRLKSGRKTALFLSRINPKKGLPMLLEAWKEAADGDWCLLIAGNDDSNHLREVEQKIKELGLKERVTIAGPLFGEEKEIAYKQADLFVLPSYSENFGIVVAEALGYGLPVLTTKGCPWQELQTCECGWWVEPTQVGIKTGLSEALSSSSQDLVAMGARGRRLVEDKYNWSGVADRMLEFYEWSLNGGKRPNFVI